MMGSPLGVPTIFESAVTAVVLVAALLAVTLIH